MISCLIPEPYREQLLEAGKMANTGTRPADELAVVAASVDLIRAKCAREHPHIFRQELSDD
jgi:hypothetical protein